MKTTEKVSAISKSEQVRAIEERVRGMFPELKPSKLELGCLCKILEMPEMENHRFVTPKSLACNIFIYSGFANQGTYNACRSFTDEKDCMQVKFSALESWEEKIDIVGHPVTHIHILRALNKLDRFDGIVSITAEGYITSLEMDVRGLGYKVDICKLDISQSWQTQEEAVEKIYNLLIK